MQLYLCTPHSLHYFLEPWLLLMFSWRLWQRLGRFSGIRAIRQIKKTTTKTRHHDCFSIYKADFSIAYSSIAYPLVKWTHTYRKHIHAALPVQLLWCVEGKITPASSSPVLSSAVYQPRAWKRENQNTQKSRSTENLPCGRLPQLLIIPAVSCSAVDVVSKPQPQPCRVIFWRGWRDVCVYVCSCVRKRAQSASCFTHTHVSKLGAVRRKRCLRTSSRFPRCLQGIPSDFKHACERRSRSWSSCSTLDYRNDGISVSLGLSLSLSVSLVHSLLHIEIKFQQIS